MVGPHGGRMYMPWARANCVLAIGTYVNMYWAIGTETIMDTAKKQRGCRLKLPAAPQRVGARRVFERVYRKRLSLICFVSTKKAAQLTRQRDSPTWATVLVVSLNLLAPLLFKLVPRQVPLELLLRLPELVRLRLRVFEVFTQESIIQMLR